MKAEAHVWLPIESAPKDGTEVLVYVPKKQVRSAKSLREYFAYIAIGFSTNRGIQKRNHFG